MSGIGEQGSEETQNYPEFVDPSVLQYSSQLGPSDYGQSRPKSRPGSSDRSQAFQPIAGLFDGQFQVPHLSTKIAIVSAHG
jgi:hypothetical protein